MTKILDLDALLDQNLANVEAAPEYVKPDTGNYRLELIKVRIQEREARDKEKAVAEGKPTAWGVMSFDYAIKEVHSLQAGGLPVKVDSIFSESFNLTEQGLPYLKARVATLVEVTGGSAEDADSMGLRDVMTAFPQMGIIFDAHLKNAKSILDNGNEWEETRMSQIQAIS